MIENPDTSNVSTDEVTIWRIPLDQPPEVVRRLESTLSIGEQGRADRYRTDQLKGRFVVGRGSMRVILGDLLGEPPASLRFALGPNGKPFLADSGNPPPLEFNMSHSHGHAVLAVARGRRVGIDIELIRPMDDVEPLVVRYFSPSEQAAILGLSAPSRLHAFFRCWTRKEAYLKAIGDGLTVELDHFDVSLDPEAPPRLLRVEGRPDEPDRWRFEELTTALEAIATVAVEGTGWQLRMLDHDPARPFSGGSRRK